MKAAEAVVNSSGGILGHQVEITTMDDQASGTQAVTDAQQALASGVQYNEIIGGCFGQDSVPLASAFAHTAALQFAPLPDNLIESNKYPNLFLSGGSLTSAGEIAMATEMRSKGVRRFAIVTGDDASGQQGAQELKAAAKSLGMTVTAAEFVPDTAVDATAEVQAALASNPQALAVNNFTPVIPAILAARTKLGAKLPLYGDAYVSALNLGPATTKAEREGVIEEAFPILIKANHAQQSPAYQLFIKYDARYDKKPLLSLYADIAGWDYIMEARGAAIAAKTISGAGLVSALAKLPSTAAIPDFLGGTWRNSTSYHAWVVTPADYDYVPAGISVGGIIDPGT